jgi:hypothetical protein
MGRVSHVQELQMITVDSPNVHVYRTEGDTDEQAEALKVVFTDAEFMRRHKVCSINSINWARVLVQSGYYLWACLQVAPDARMRVNFVVPTGAFGNAAGGLLAKRLGAPIERIVCATNANDIVHRTIQTGDLSFGANRQTISPAMDIQFAYNLERLLYLCSAGDCSLVKAIMTELESTRAVQLPRPLLDAIQQTFLSCAVDDAQTLQAMERSKLLPKFAHGETAVNCHHNYVQQERHFGEDVWVTRKGAVSAQQGQLGIIPGSMGAKSYIVRGKGNPDSFHSCSHGAGRAMSRGEATRKFTVQDHERATAGVECRKDEGVLDETPMAYKDIDAVMAAQSDLVEVVHTLKQVLCIKG